MTPTLVFDFAFCGTVGVGLGVLICILLAALMGFLD